MARILAIDYGQKRCGIAVTDEMQLVANALDTIATAGLMDFLKNYCMMEKVELFVVGMPKQMNNKPSESVKYIIPFVKQLHKNFPEIAIAEMDERFTSKMAFQTMIDAGLKKKDRQNKALVDRISATILLQSYMEIHEKFNK
ncbi:MAG: Holliday junction resolvase RuvX [Lentimicrobiaceae bacterium]|nr:Holliday junction resolvase RuvX [Lentimicrobiaceae bacterium]